MSVFVTEIRLRSTHCDPAGRLQTGRYFELVNRVVEDWFAEAVGLPFSDMHASERRIGIPTAHLTLEVHRPSRLGEVLTLSLRVSELRRSAIRVAVEVRCGEEPRFEAEAVLVMADTSGERPRGMEIPPPLRAKMDPYMTRPAGAPSGRG